MVLKWFKRRNDGKIQLALKIQPRQTGGKVKKKKKKVDSCYRIRSIAFFFSQTLVRPTTPYCLRIYGIRDFTTIQDAIIRTVQYFVEMADSW